MTNTQFEFENNYLTGARKILDRIERTQLEMVEKASQICANTILNGSVVHLFGSGHSRMAVEEVYPRYGSFPGFHPMVELSLTNHHQVVGNNGQRQAMFLENVEGLAKVILSNFHFKAHDSILVFSHSGTNIVPLEIAMEMQQLGFPVVAVTSLAHSKLAVSKHSSGKKLYECADVVLDNCAIPGDAMVEIDGLETPVGPGSTIGNTAIVNMIKCRVAQLLTEAGRPPKVLTSSLVIGEEKSKSLFHESYEEFWASTRYL